VKQAANVTGEGGGSKEQLQLSMLGGGGERTAGFAVNPKCSPRGSKPAGKGISSPPRGSNHIRQPRKHGVPGSKKRYPNGVQMGYGFSVLAEYWDCCTCHDG
jgi:hypothetical protein